MLVETDARVLEGSPIDVDTVKRIHLHEFLERDNKGATIVIIRSHRGENSTTSTPSTNADKDFERRVRPLEISQLGVLFRIARTHLCNGISVLVDECECKIEMSPLSYVDV